MSKRPVISLIMLAMLATFAACKKDQTSSSNSNNKTSQQSTPDQFATARESFTKNCQSCHGPTGEGGPVKLDDGTKLKVPSLREGHALRHTDTEFVTQISKGGDGMPAFAGKLTTQQIDDLVRFIRHEFQGK